MSSQTTLSIMVSKLEPKSLFWAYTSGSAARFSLSNGEGRKRHVAGQVVVARGTQRAAAGVRRGTLPNVDPDVVAGQVVVLDFGEAAGHHQDSRTRVADRVAVDGVDLQVADSNPGRVGSADGVAGNADGTEGIVTGGDPITSGVRQRVVRHRDVLAEEARIDPVGTGRGGGDVPDRVVMDVQAVRVVGLVVPPGKDADRALRKVAVGDVVDQVVVDLQVLHGPDC